MAKGKYTHYSQTTSGGTIYINPDAAPDKRWLIKHKHFGDKYFAEHDDILKWTVEQMREQYKRMSSK
jgi:hypothetical protein